VIAARDNQEIEESEAAAATCTMASPRQFRVRQLGNGQIVRVPGRVQARLSWLVLPDFMCILASCEGGDAVRTSIPDFPIIPLYLK
jgi:hypothetical protein